MPRTTLATTVLSTDRFSVVGLDGLRAIAVGTVVVFHAFPDVLPGGFLGVDVFFVVSGFLITALLLREARLAEGISAGTPVAHRPIDLRGFWLRRARRLLPALIAMLFMSTLLAVLVGGDALVNLGAQLVGSLTFSANWVLLGLGQDYFSDTTPELFRHLWSLGVEEQFYLLWPLIALVLLRLPHVVRIVGIATLAVASALLMALFSDPALPSRVYYGTDTHAFGLLLGALLAVISTRWPAHPLEWPRSARIVLSTLGPVALAGIVALAIAMPAGSPVVFQGGLVLVAVLTGIVIASLLVPGSAPGSLLDAAPLAWIGRRSYAIYLWHWPLLVLAWLVYPGTPRVGWESVPLGLAAIVVAVATSAFSYSLLEQPIRRDGLRATLIRWRDHSPGGRSAAALTSVALLASAGVLIAMVIERAPTVGVAQAAIAAGIAALEDDESAPPGDPGPASDVAPDDVRPASGSEISMVGDSVTLAAVPTLKDRFPGIRIDAAVSRHLVEGLTVLRRWRDQDKLRDVVIVALGTNGPIADEDLRDIRRIIGPERSLILVTAHAPRGWIPGVNRQLTRFADEHRNVELANWSRAIQPHLDVLAPDQIHFAGAGARIFASSLEGALRRLAELPPLRDDRDILTYPLPV